MNLNDLPNEVTPPEENNAALDALPSSETPAEQAYHSVKGTNPNDAAQILLVAKKTGKPVQFVAENFADVDMNEVKLPQSFWNELDKQYSNTSKWLSNPHNMAVASDDFDNLPLFERYYTEATFGFRQGRLTQKLSDLRGKQMDELKKTGKISKQYEADLNIVKGELSGMEGTAPKGFHPIYNFANQLPNWIGGAASGLKVGIPAAGVGALTALGLGQLGPQALIPEELVTVPGAAIALGKVGAAAGAGLYAYNIERNLAFDQYADLKDKNGKPLDPKTAAEAAELVGVINGALETVGDVVLFKGIAQPIGKGAVAALSKVPGAAKVLGYIQKNPAVFAKMTMRQAVQQAVKTLVLTEVGEISTEYAQEVMTGSGQNLAIGASGQDIAKTPTLDILSQAGGVISPTAQAVLIPGLIGGSFNVYKSKKAIAVAEQNAQAFTAMTEATKNSETFKRLPEAYQELVNEVTKDGPIDGIWIRPAALENHLSKQGIDTAQALSEIGIDSKLYQEAQEMGDLKIPMSQWDKVVRSKQFAGIAKDIRLHQEDLSVNEAKELEAEVKKREAETEKGLQEMVKQGEAATEKDAQAKADWTKVHSLVKAELESVGMETEQADKNAKMWAAWALTQAKATGKTVDQILEGRPGITRTTQAASQRLNQFAGPNAKTESPEFKAWFGDSKVVDEKGQPLVAYHGSGTNIEEFKYEFTNQGADQLGSGFYFTTDKAEADSYQNRLKPGESEKFGGQNQPTTHEVYLSLKNPLDASKVQKLTTAQVKNILKAAPNLDDALSNWGDVGYEGKAAVIKTAAETYAGMEQELLKTLNAISNDVFGNNIQAFNSAVRKTLGYDGVVSDIGNKKHYVAWFPEQIKSINNRGTFDPNNPNILMQRGGPQNLVAVHNLSADNPLNSLPDFKGKAYRVDTGFIQGNKTSALDVINFEENELGNKEYGHLSSEQRNALKNYNAKDIVWVTKLKSDAARYSEGDISSVEDYTNQLGDNPKIITEDGDGGYLVFRGTFDPNNPNILMQRGGGPQNLVAVHNLSADKLLHADKMGGLAVPSIAISRTEHPLKNFGDITLIGSADLIDPRTKSNKVFNSDIYSPRYPSITYEIDSLAIKKAREFVTKEERDLDTRLDYYLDSYDFARNGMKAVADSPIVKLKYLRSIGKDIEIIKKTDQSHYLKLNPDIEKVMDKYSLPYDLRNNKDFLREYEKLRAAEMDAEREDALKAGSSKEDADKIAEQMGRILYDKEGKPNINFIRDIQGEISAREKIGETDIYATERAIREAMPIEQADYNKWVSEHFGGLVGKEKIFKGFTPSGNRRYVPHTLDNVVLEMKKELQGGEALNYGLGSLRAEIAKRYRTLQQIMVERDKIVSYEEFEKAREIVGGEFDNILDEARKKYTGKADFGTADTFLENLKEGIRRGNIEKELSEYGFPGMDIERIKAFLSTIREMPTEYFEAKIQRAVGLNEFSGAVIPKSAPQAVRDVLKNNGIPFREYEGENRAEVLRQFTQDLNNKGLDILFQAPAESFGEIGRIPVPERVRYEYFEESNRVEFEVLQEYKEHADDPNYRQSWTLVPSAQIKKVWNDYANMGFVQNEKALEDIVDTVSHNIHKLTVNTLLANHTEIDSVRWASDILDEELPEGYFDKAESFFDDDNGAWRISDYALDKLNNLNMQLLAARSPEEKLLTVDRILNVVHQRSDLPGWFIEGGTQTLDELKNNGAAGPYLQSAGRELAPTFYSKLQRTLEAKMPERASPAQIQGIIKDLKPEELKWSGIEEFLAGKDKVSKQELLDFLHGNQLEIKEVAKGGAPNISIEPWGDGWDLSNDANIENGSHLSENEDGTYKISFRSGEEKTYDSKEEALSDYREIVGISNSDSSTKFSTYQLPGGEGMRSFYDQMIPQALNDFGKKFGAKVGETGLNTGTETYSLYNSATGSSVGGGYTKSEAEAKVSKNPHYTMKRESGGDTNAHSLDITPALKEAALYEGFSLFQKKSKAPRGFYDPSENIIGLLKNKNASTFMHESAHYWLKDIFDFVRSGKADEEYLKRWEPMRKFLSISDLQTTLTRSQQEMFARHLEAYLMEGKAPSLELQDVFASFRQWLTRIYKTIKRLAAEAGFSVEVTPEVQDFFDHLFATEQEIEAARAETGLNEAASLSPDQAVEELRKQAHNAAVDALTKSVMKELKADYQKEKQAYRAKFTKEEENRIRKYPAYAAMETLRNSKAFRGKDPFYEAGLYLNGGLTDEGRAEFDAIAMTLGHEDGYPLARLITEAEPFSGVLADHVEQEMAAKFGNMTEAPDFHEKAIEAVHNDRQLELMALEREILRGMTGEQDEKAVRKPLTEVTRRAANVEAKVIKRRAADILADKTYRDASQYRIFLTAEKNAAIALGRALAKKDITAATLAKQHQMFNHALAMESLRIRGQGEAVAEALMKAGDKTEKLPSSGKLPITAAANVQINRLLARFGFADPVNVPEGTPTLAQYVEEQQGHADEVVVADWLMGDTAPVVNWKDLSINQLLDLKDAIASLKQAGKRENTLSTGESLDEVVSSFVSEIYANGKVKPGDYDPARQHTAGDVAAKFVNSHRSLAYIMRALDGRKFGKLSAFVMGRLRKARHNESVMGAEAMQKVEALWDKHYPAEGDVPFKKWKKRTDMATAREFFEDPAINAIFPKGVTKENLIMMALNQGTELNKQRLLESYAMKSVDEEGNPTWQYRLTQDNVDKILSRLDKNDWDFVQGVLDLVNSYWPKIAELERNRTGLEPRKREAATINTPFGNLPGGYFHIEYDPFASEPANRQTLEDSMKGAIEGSHIVPSTRRGHTKETVTHVYQRPLLLQFSVIDRHLQAVIHDLAFIETIRDLDRVLTNPDVTQAIKETKGDIAYRQIRPALAYIGFENRPQASPIDAMLSGIRARASAYYLMFRITSILSQIAGAGVAMGSVGAHKYVGNLITMTPDKARMILDKSRIMRERLGNRDRDVRDAMRSFMEKGKLNGVTKYGFFLQGYMDIAVAMPQWMAAYENELQRQTEAGEQADEDRAITVADETVQSTQGSGDPIDQSAMQRGSEFMKLLTMFYTPFAPLANKQIELWEGLRENGIKDVPEVLSFLSFWIVLPGIMAAALSGDLPDGDDDDNSWFTWIIRNSLAQFFGGWIGARDMASYVSNKATGKNMGYRLTPVEAVVEKGLEPMVDAFKGNATADPADFAKGAANTAMLWFKLPGRQIDITVGYLVDLMSGNAEFEPRRLIYPEKKK